jgi:hypothetical protein
MSVEVASRYSPFSLVLKKPTALEISEGGSLS